MEAITGRSASILNMNLMLYGTMDLEQLKWDREAYENAKYKFRAGCDPASGSLLIFGTGGDGDMGTMTFKQMWDESK